MVRVWKFLLLPFWESRSPFGSLLTHLRGIFSVTPHSSSSVPLASSLLYILAIAASIIGWIRVGGVGGVMIP